MQLGPGVGGHCIAVDPWFIVDSAPEESRLIRTAREVNDSKPHNVTDRVRRKAERFKEPTIACFGLAFKANIDDLRESPAIDIALGLAKEYIGNLLLVEPNIDRFPEASTCREKVLLAEMDTALDQADILVGLIDHDEFKALNYK